MAEDREKMIQNLKETLGPYGYTISTTMILFGQAVATVLDNRDRPVLEEMKKVTAEIFEEAEKVMREQSEEKVQ